MRRFANTQAEQAFGQGFVSGLPRRLGRDAHRIIRLLAAAHELQDVGIVGRLARWPNRPGRYGISVTGKWFVTFQWETLAGAVEIRLERRR